MTEDGEVATYTSQVVWKLFSNGMGMEVNMDYLHHY
jgi:hypothetical protein